MKKNTFLVVLLLLVGLTIVDSLSAQVRFGYGPMHHGRYYSHAYGQPSQSTSNSNNQKNEVHKFIPTVNIAVGYGFPNLDKYLLPDLNSHGVVKGDYEQTGTMHAAIDYQFNRYTSIGVMGLLGRTSVPYFLAGALPNDPAVYNASLENWTVMFNMVNYFAPVDMVKVNGYLRTSVGVNVWNQKITDASGIKQNNLATSPTELAYQVSLGADFNLSPRAAFFIEAGYGKYILSGGLKFKF